MIIYYTKIIQNDNIINNLKDCLKRKTKSNISYTKKYLGNKYIIIKLNCSLIFLLILGNDML